MCECALLCVQRVWAIRVCQPACILAHHCVQTAYFEALCKCVGTSLHDLILYSVYELVCALGIVKS